MEKKQVVIVVKGGVAEVRECPDDVEVTIKDLDTTCNQCDCEVCECNDGR